MRIDFHGLVLETPRVGVYLWSPWRASALENRLFEAVRQSLGQRPEAGPDELRLTVTEPRQWRGAWQAMIRVLKGWQEEAEAGSERRVWRWLLEADTDDHGYDSFGEPLSLWVYLRLTLDRSNPSEQARGEDVELDGFGIRFWGEKA